MSQFAHIIKAPSLPLAMALLATLLLPTARAAAQGPMQARTWTDSTGTYTVEATMLGIEGDRVTLQRTDGRKVVVPLDKLSKADQEYVRAATFTTTTAHGPAVAPRKLPLNPAWLSDHFSIVIVARPAKMSQSQLSQEIQKMFPLPNVNKRWGIDFSQLEWAIVMIGYSPDVLDANGAVDAVKIPEIPQADRIQLITILVSQQPLDQAAIKASGELSDLSESTLDGKTYWTARTADGNAGEFLFYDDRTLLVGKTAGQIQKMLTAKPQGGKLAAKVQQLDLNHEMAVVAVPTRIPILEGDGDAGVFNKLMQKLDYAVAYIDMDKAIKVSAQVVSTDAAQALQIKQSVEAGVGFGKLMAMTTLQDALKDYRGDITPLTSLISDTLNSFQSSVDGKAVHFSIATPDDTFNRALKSFPIFIALMNRTQASADQTAESP